MKKQILGLLLLVCALAIAFLIMSCAPGPQNTNQPSNTSATSTNGVVVTKQCNVTNVENNVLDMIKFAGLEDQHKPNAQGKRNLDFKVVSMGNPAMTVLIVEGAISDGKKGNNGQNSKYMDTFIREVDKLINKDCVAKAIFVKRGTIATVTQNPSLLDDIVGFEWSACDWPQVPCGGKCADSCPDGGSSTTNSAANVNANQSNNTNANKSNTNVNSNTNRAP